MNLFYCDYTKAVLLEACQALGLGTPSSYNKGQVINALCCVDDQEVAHKAVLIEAGELEPDTPPSDFDMDSYLKSELKEAALSLDISISWSYTKARIIEELKGYPDQMAVYQAVIAAAGE